MKYRIKRVNHGKFTIQSSRIGLIWSDVKREITNSGKGTVSVPFEFENITSAQIHLENLENGTHV